VDHLWAPWRLTYIASPKGKPADGDDCFICRGAGATDDRAGLVVHRSALSVVVLNRFPYNNGHLLVCPKAHKGQLDDLTNDELLDLQFLLRQMMGVIRKRMNADGFNVGLNLGRVAGAGVPGHLHWHIVPRWQGDTNFMPVVADTKVISQSLEALYDLLREELAGEPRTGERG
jgi:ATP adenylyltransferase